MNVRGGGRMRNELIKYALQEAILQADEFQVLGVGTLELEGAVVLESG